MRVLVTRSRKDASNFALVLGRIGAEVFFLPTIDIQPVADSSQLDKAITRLHDYDWLVLTSANGVDAILESSTRLGINLFPKNLRIAAVGPKTAARLQDAGITPDFIPDEYIAEEILPGLGDLTDRWVLLPLADIAHDTLPNAICSASGIAHVITAYHTLPAEPDPDGLAAIRDGVDVVTFTSGSTVLNFIILLTHEGLDPFHLPGDPIIACIGPKTAKTAELSGFTVEIVASTYTVEGLVEAIASHYRKIFAHEAH